VKAAKLGVPPSGVFEAMQVYLGRPTINDFNYLGRTYQVIAQLTPLSDDGRAGRIPVNPSGGLESKGTSDRATGLGQMSDLRTRSQLRAEAGPRQVADATHLRSPRTAAASMALRRRWPHYGAGPLTVREWPRAVPGCVVQI